MDKYAAVTELMKDARASRVSTASARRSVKAAKALGFTSEEIVRLMSWLDYCPASGEPYSAKIQRVW